MSAALVDRLLPDLHENAVLGLGEPTHGSADAFAWKLEVIHELARDGWLAMLAFEESFAVGLQVEAALHGDGDLEAAWGQGSSIWDTVTIREGLRTLGQITATLPPARRPRFLGVDISKPYRTARALQERGVGAPVLEAVAARSSLTTDECSELEALCRTVEADRIASTDPTTALLARNLRRHADAYLAAPDLSRLHRRDTHMADTLLENLPEQGITVLWAHNEHLARNPESWGGPTMGHVLHEALGQRYAPVGVLCGGGECRAVDPSTGSDDYAAAPLPPLHPDTTDEALRALGAAGAAASVHGATVVTSEEFTHPGPRRFVGWQVDTSLFADQEAVRDTFEVQRPSSDFSALALLPRSTADVTGHTVGDAPRHDG